MTATSTTPHRTFHEIVQGAQLISALSGWDFTVGERCTCCDTDRVVIRWGGDREEWGHLDDDTIAETRHIHVDSSSSDCDGRYSRGHIVRLNSGIADWAVRPSPPGEQQVPTFFDLVTYTFRHEAGLWSGPTTINVDADGGRMTWSTTTDEGGCAGTARVCDDPWCAYEADLFRDHRAESMGY